MEENSLQTIRVLQKLFKPYIQSCHGSFGNLANFVKVFSTGKQIIILGTWTKPGNQRKYLDFVFQSMNFKKWEDWYKIKAKDILDLGGLSMISVFMK